MIKQEDKVKPEVITYLKRIQYTGPIEPTIDTLAQLQECHLHTVPYENFDIMSQIPLSLEIPALFEKIVINERGGYCFELNALFSWLLRELGYNVTDFFARFWRDEPNPPPKRRHHVIQVEAEGRKYLCDVGVGGIVPRRPIQMVEGLVHEQGTEFYKLRKDSDFGWMLQEKKGEQWHDLYSFTEEKQLPKDFIMATYWCENAPDSIFIDDAMVAIRTPEGRNTISGKEFRIFTNSGVTVMIPQSKEEFVRFLDQYFKLKLPDDQLNKLVHMYN